MIREQKNRKSVMSHKHTRLIAILPIIAGAFWGIVGVFVRILDAEGLDNLTICFSRAAVGALVLIVFVLLTDRKLFHVEIRDLPVIFGMSLSGAVLLMFAYNYALTELTISLAVVLLCTAPVFVLLISSLVFKERISLKKLICMVLAFVGCAMLSGLFEGDAPLRWSVFGLLMGLAAAFFNGVYMILSKGIAKKHYSPITISVYSFIFGALMLLPFVSWEQLSGYISAKPLESAAVLLLQSICSSLIPTVAYITAVKYMDAGKAAILESGAEPTAAVIVGIALYSEIPSLIGLAGMIITVGALAVLASDKE